MMPKGKTVVLTLFNGETMKIEERFLWSQVILRYDLCVKCGSGDVITLHSHDIPRIVRMLKKAYKSLSRKI